MRKNRSIGTMRWPVLWAVALAAATHPGWAQLRAGAIYTSSDPASDNGFPRLRVVLSPANPQTSLQAADLVAVEDGHEQQKAVEVRSFESAGYPMAAAVVIDVSGSMSGAPVETLRRSLVQFVNDARPKDKIAVLTVADDTRWDAPFGADRDAVRQQLAALQPRGHLTRLYDGMLEAMGGFQPSLPQRRELTVISDGHDEGSRSTFEQVIEMAHTRGIAIDAIGMTRSDPQYLKILESMAQQTGGSFRVAQSNEELEALLGNAITNLKNTPVATFELNRIAPDAKRHQLAVRWKKDGSLSNTVAFVAPNKAAHPLPYFLHHLPVWAWAAAGGVLLLVIVGIVLAVLSSAAKKRRMAEMRAQQAAAIPLAPHFEAEPEAVYVPTVDLDTSRQEAASAQPEAWQPPAPPVRRPELVRPPEPMPQVAPVTPPSPSFDARKTMIGGVFPGHRGPLAKLVAEAGPRVGQSVAVTRESFRDGKFWIGAAQGCALEMAEDETVSGHHAYLVFEDPILILVDNRSTNGTWLNGSHFRAAARPLKSGDRIQIGRTLFRIDA